MTSHDWKKLEQLFESMVGLPTVEREAFLSAQAVDDPALVDQLRALAAAHDTRHPLLDAATLPNLAEGTRIGPYAVERILGAGGMGTVYLARRADQQFEKQVAIKLIPPGLAGSLVAGRFHDERQILASLEHPNVARLLDAGFTEFGQPYLVMEYVDGQTLDVWCDQHPHPIEPRLKLWAKIAAAVGYAHRNLVVHRDLKPGNILVDANGEPKLVDFGIAKLLENPQADSHSVSGMNLLTPSYASPEQLKGARVTTASDIYSLGVILYLMLTGEHPFRRADQTPLDLMAAVLKEEPRFPKELAADLKAIVNKALDKDPLGRYTTVDQFVDDVTRYREGQTVVARAPTLAYRAGKFVRRHRLAISVAIVTTLTIVGFALAAFIQARRAERERILAERVTNFLTQVLGRNPGPLSGEYPHSVQQLRVVDVLDRASLRVGTELDGQPEVEAPVRQVLASMYVRLGRFSDAERENKRGLELARKLYGPRDAQVLNAEVLDGVVRTNLGQFREAEQVFNHVLDSWKPLPGNVQASLFPILGLALFRLGKLDASEQALTKGLDALKAAGPDAEPERALAHSNLGLVFLERANIPRAAVEFERCSQASRSVSPPPDALGWCLVNLGNTYRFLGRYDESLAVSREALQAMTVSLGENHPSLIHPIALVAFGMSHRGERGAEELIRHGVALQDRGLPANHFERAVGWTFLGFVLMNENKLAEAEQWLSKALALRQKAFQQPNWRIAETEGYLGEALAREGRKDEARPLLEDSARVYELVFGANVALVKDARARLARWGQ